MLGPEEIEAASGWAFTPRVTPCTARRDNARPLAIAASLAALRDVCTLVSHDMLHCHDKQPSDFLTHTNHHVSTHNSPCQP